MWICPGCKTINRGAVCTGCGQTKPAVKDGSVSFIGSLGGIWTLGNVIFSALPLIAALLALFSPFIVYNRVKISVSRSKILFDSMSYWIYNSELNFHQFLLTVLCILLYLALAVHVASFIWKSHKIVNAARFTVIGCDAVILLYLIGLRSEFGSLIAGSGFDVFWMDFPGISLNWFPYVLGIVLCMVPTVLRNRPIPALNTRLYSFSSTGGFALHDARSWVCTGCGTRNKGAFCTHCGNRQPEATGPRTHTNALWSCDRCGATNRGSFCGRCGNKKSETAPPSWNGFHAPKGF